MSSIWKIILLFYILTWSRWHTITFIRLSDSYLIYFTMTKLTFYLNYYDELSAHLTEVKGPQCFPCLVCHLQFWKKALVRTGVPDVTSESGYAIKTYILFTLLWRTINVLIRSKTTTMFHMLRLPFVDLENVLARTAMSDITSEGRLCNSKVT